MEQNKELSQKFAMFEQQIMTIQQQLQAVEQNILDLDDLEKGIEEIKDGKEILASVGKGIFAKAKLISEELTVDVGGKNYVKKSIEDTKKLILEQIKKLEEIKNALEKELEKINEELTSTMLKAQEKFVEKEKKE